MRALLIWGSLALCVLAVSSSESGKEEAPQSLAALIGKEDGVRRRERSDWLADSPSVALQEFRAAIPWNPKWRTCVSCFTALIVNDEAGAGNKRNKRNTRKPKNAMIGRSLKPKKDEDQIKVGDCNLMPPNEKVPFDTSSRNSKRQRRSDSEVQPPKKVKPPRPGSLGPLIKETKTKRHTEDGHGRHQRNGKKRDEERRGRKRHECKPKEEEPTQTSVPGLSSVDGQHAEDGHGRHQRNGKKWRDEDWRGRKRECKPKEEEPTQTLGPELSSVDGQVKEKRPHRGHDRQRGRPRQKLRPGSTTSLFEVPPPSGEKTEPDDGKAWWTELSRQRRQNDWWNKKPQQNRPRPGWGSAIAGVKPIEPIKI